MHRIPVTKENLEYKAQLDAIDIEKIQADPDEMLNKILDNMKLGEKAENTLVTGSPIDDIRTALVLLTGQSIQMLQMWYQKGKHLQ